MSIIYSPNIDAATSGQILPGWTANSGTWTVGAYSPVPGHTKSFGQATMLNASTAIYTAASALTDMEVFFDQVIQAAVSTTPIMGAVLRCDAAAKNGYLFLLVPGATNVSLHVFKFVAGVTTALITTGITVAGYAAGISVSMRAKVYGNTVAASVWPTGGTEPASPQVSLTDTSVVSPGYLGLYASTSGGTAGIDNLTIADAITGVTPTVGVTNPSGVSTVGTTVVSGPYTGYAPDPLLYALDGATPSIPMTNFSIPTIGTWEGSIAAPAAGTHVLDVAYSQTPSVTAASGQFTATTPTVAVIAPSGITAGAVFLMSGTYTTSPPPGLQYDYDGGSGSLPLSSFQASGGTWEGIAIAPVQGLHQVAVSYTGAPSIVSPSVTFSVGAALVMPTITVNTPQTCAAGETITITGSISDPTQPINFQFDSAGYAAAPSPTILNGKYSFRATAPAAGAHAVSVQLADATTVTATSGAFTSVATQVLAANNPAIVYSPYNWDVQASRALSINAGAYLSLFFAGSYVELDFDVSLMGPVVSEIEYRIDGYETQSPWITVPVASSVVPVMPPDTSAAPFHLLEVRIKSTSQTYNRWVTTTTCTAVKLTGIAITAGSAAVAPGTATIKILEFGTSISEAVRAVNQTATLDTDQNSAGMGWALELRRLLGAEIGVVGFGSSGLTGNGSGGVPPLPTSYALIASGIPRSFSPPPDLIILEEGTNDGTASPALVTANMILVLNGLLADCPGSPIAVLEPFNGNQAAALQAACAGCSNPLLVHYVPTTGFFNTSYGADSLNLHPKGPNDLAIISPLVAAAVRPLLSAGGRAPWYRGMAG